jgi:2EXR family
MLYYGNICQPLFPYGVAASKPLKHFTLFPELPFEIRLVIWQIAIRFGYNPTVRLLPIRDVNNGAIIFHDLICQSLTPIVLHINHESRTEALKHYTLSLGGTTYLNKSTGTVFLDSNEPGELTHFVTSVPQHELQTIENIAVKLCEWSWMDETFKEAIWQFTNIKRLAMIFSKPDDSFYLTKSAYKLISQELRKPKESSDEWKVPTICLVSSELVEGFLKSNNFA